jgi:hypothetical protein
MSKVPSWAISPDLAKMMAADVSLLERFYKGEEDSIRGEIGEEEYEEFVKRVRLYQNTMAAKVGNIMEESDSE